MLWWKSGLNLQFSFLQWDSRIVQCCISAHHRGVSSSQIALLKSKCVIIFVENINYYGFDPNPNNPHNLRDGHYLHFPQKVLKLIRYHLTPFCKTCFTTSESFWHAQNNLVSRHQEVGLGQTPPSLGIFPT